MPKGTPALAAAEATRLGHEVPRWKSDGKSLARDLRFADFKAALAFVDDVGRIAEAESHHPDLHLTGYRNVRVETSTHSVGGLSENDFILAAKVDRIPGAGP